MDAVQTIDHLADALIGLGDRAGKLSTWLARLARLSLVAGVVGGVCATLALFGPGVGFVRSWFMTLVSLAAVAWAAWVVQRWSKRLYAWDGHVHAAANRVRSLSSADVHVKQAMRMVGSAHKSSGGALRLVRTALKLRPAVMSAMNDGREVIDGLTGPFRPPFVALRVTLLFGGVAAAVVGPLLLIAAIAT